MTRVWTIRGKSSRGALRHIQQAETLTEDKYGGFNNDIHSSWEELSQDKIRKAIDIHSQSMEDIIATKGGRTNYMNNGSAS